MSIKNLDAKSWLLSAALTISSTLKISALLKLRNFSPAPSDSTASTKDKFVRVFVFGVVWVFVIYAAYSIFDELTIVLPVPKSAVPPVAPPLNVIVGLIVEISLSAFANMKLTRDMYQSVIENSRKEMKPLLMTYSIF